MPTYSNEVVNLLESDEEGSVLAVWDSASGRREEGCDDDSVVVLEDQRMGNEETEEQGFDSQMDGLSEVSIERPAAFGYDNWRKFSDMHPGRPNGMGFLIFGSPQTWSRPLFLHRFANGRFLRNVVDANRTKVQRIRDLVIQDARNNFDVDLRSAPYYGDLPVCVKLCFYRRLPNSAFVNERRTNPLKQNWKQEIVGTPDTSRPDLDNMCKLIIDSLQGLLYKDDQSVAKIVASKCWDFEFPYDGKTEIDVHYLDDGNIFD